MNLFCLRFYKCDILCRSVLFAFVVILFFLLVLYLVGWAELMQKYLVKLRFNIRSFSCAYFSKMVNLQGRVLMNLA